MDLPQPPSDTELRNIIDKLAQFVARNGPEFEQMTKNKQKGNPKFSFLYGGDYYNYYTYKVNAEQAILSVKPGGSYYPPRTPNRQFTPESLHRPPPPGPLLGPPPLSGPSVYGPLRNGSPRGRPEPWSPRPRPLMDIPIYPPPLESPSSSSHHLSPSVQELSEQCSEMMSQINALREQISQSESNLLAQENVSTSKMNLISKDIIAKGQFERLDTLCQNTSNISLEKMSSVLAPIVESCTKDSISLGKAWIFSNATSHDNNQIIAGYLNYRVTLQDSNFNTQLHLIYLMNDVLHHCLRKGSEDLKNAFEAVAVEMFSTAFLSASEEQRLKLNKLIVLWEKKNIFSFSTLSKMKDPKGSLSSILEQRSLDYGAEISAVTEPLRLTLENYKSQHVNFVAHAHSHIASLDSRIQSHQESLVSLSEKRDSSWNLEKCRSSRSSRWDSWNNLPPPPLPDISKPPPGFNIPPPQSPVIVRSIDDSHLIPTIPYYDLPAGLMVPLVPLQNYGYKHSLDPSKIRLPPPNPPSERLLIALEAFYAPPSHERPRDPEGWEILGLYEWSKAKSEAIANKKDAISSGKRSESPQSPFFSEAFEYEEEKEKKGNNDDDDENENEDDEHENKDEGSKAFKYGIKRKVKKRVYTSRESTPESKRRTKSLERRRSSSPENFIGFSGNEGKATTKLDSSNKGHQMMEKMGWKSGSGLGSGESGIVEPISGGDVREKKDQYKGMGSHNDPFEAFRKNKAGSFYIRMKERADTRKNN